MKLLLIAFALLGALFVPVQDRTLTTTAVGNVITVKWTAPPEHLTSDWIALYPVGAPVEPFPSSLLWKYVPAGASGEMTFTAPANGEWEARYLSPVNLVLTTSPALVIGTPDDPPPPVDEPVRLRQIRLYKDGVLFSTQETLDGTEAARHLTNFAVSSARGEFIVETRYASVAYPAQPDEVGSWRK